MRSLSFAPSYRRWDLWRYTSWWATPSALMSERWEVGPRRGVEPTGEQVTGAMEDDHDLQQLTGDQPGAVTTVAPRLLTLLGVGVQVAGQL